MEVTASFVATSSEEVACSARASCGAWLSVLMDEHTFGYSCTMATQGEGKEPKIAKLTRQGTISESPGAVPPTGRTQSFCSEQSKSWLVRWWRYVRDRSGVVLYCRIGLDKASEDDVIKALRRERFVVCRKGVDKAGTVVLEVSDNRRVFLLRRAVKRWLPKQLWVNLDLREEGALVAIARRHIRSHVRLIRAIANRADHDIALRIYGVAASWRYGLFLRVPSLVSWDGRPIAAKLMMAHGQITTELETEAVEAWGRTSHDARLISKRLSLWTMGVSAVAILAFVQLLTVLTSFGAVYLVLMMALVGVLAYVLGRLDLSDLRPLLTQFGLVVTVGTTIGIVVARRAYETFSRVLHVTPEDLGLDWHTLAVAQGPLLLKWLLVMLAIAFGVLVWTEAQSRECRAGHVQRWRLGGRLFVYLLLGLILVYAWFDSGNAGSKAAQALLSSQQPPPGSTWLRGLDVRAVTVVDPGSAACSVTPVVPATSGILLGDDGHFVHVLVRSPSGLRPQRFPISSVALCEDMALVPASLRGVP